MTSHKNGTDQLELTNNIYAEANAMGISKNKFVFVGGESRERHYNRLRAYDMILDTFIYGSHTTGADALWHGLPLLALQGEAFASK